MEVDTTPSSPLPYICNYSHSHTRGSSSSNLVSSPSRKRNRSPSGSDGGSISKRFYRKSTSRESDLDSSLSGDPSRNGTESPAGSSDSNFNSNPNPNPNLNLNHFNQFSFNSNSNSNQNASSYFSADSQMQTLRLQSPIRGQNWIEEQDFKMGVDSRPTMDHHNQESMAMQTSSHVHAPYLMQSSRSWDGSFTQTEEENSQHSQASNDTVMNFNSSIESQQAHRRNSFSTTISNDSSSNFSNNQEEILNQSSSWLHAPQPQRALSLGGGQSLISNPSSSFSSTSPSPSTLNQDQYQFSNHSSSLIPFNHTHTPARPSPLFQSVIRSSPSSSSCSERSPSSNRNLSCPNEDQMMEVDGFKNENLGSNLENISNHGQVQGQSHKGFRGGKPLTRFTMGFREDCELCRKKTSGHFSHLVHPTN